MGNSLRRQKQNLLLEIHLATSDKAGLRHVINAAEPICIVAFDIKRAMRHICHRWAAHGFTSGCDGDPTQPLPSRNSRAIGVAIQTKSIGHPGGSSSSMTISNLSPDFLRFQPARVARPKMSAMVRCSFDNNGRAAGARLRRERGYHGGSTCDARFCRAVSAAVIPVSVSPTD
jgi:hypothetical protein